MEKISDKNSYRIDDLITTWKNGWEQLANIVRSMNITYENNFSDNPSKVNEYYKITKPELLFIMSALNEVTIQIENSEKTKNCDFNSRWMMSITWAVFCNLKKIKPEKCNNKRCCNFDDHGNSECYFVNCYRQYVYYAITEQEQLEIYKFFIKALIESATIKQAFMKLSIKSDYEWVMEYWSNEEEKDRQFHKDRFPDMVRSPSLSFNEFVSLKMPTFCYTMLEWLLKVADDPKFITEAFFNFIWLSMDPMVKQMKQIHHCIQSDVPLETNDIEFLNDIMLQKGSPQIKYYTEDINNRGDDVCRPNVVLEYTFGNTSYCESTCKKVADALLLKPAFELAMELKNKCSQPRYIKICRAPSCRKKFYTGHKDATNCPGSSYGKKNMCSLEWNRFKRYILKLGKNPAKDWDNKKVRQDFIAYDNS